MGPRRMAFWMLAVAGVAVGHLVGYTVAHPDAATREAALGGHAYLGPAATALIPLGIAAALWWAVRSARALGMGGQLDPWRLAATQIGVFALQEIGERFADGEGLSAVVTERGVWIGLLAQIVVAHLIVSSIDLVGRVVRLVVAGRPVMRTLCEPPLVIAFATPATPAYRTVAVGLRAPPVVGSPQ